MRKSGRARRQNSGSASNRTGSTRSSVLQRKGWQRASKAGRLRREQDIELIRAPIREAYSVFVGRRRKAHRDARRVGNPALDQDGALRFTTPIPMRMRARPSSIVRRATGSVRCLRGRGGEKRPGRRDENVRALRTVPLTKAKSLARTLAIQRAMTHPQNQRGAIERPWAARAYSIIGR